MHDENILKSFDWYGMSLENPENAAVCSTNICTAQCVYFANFCWHLIFIYQKQTKRKTKSTMQLTGMLLHKYFFSRFCFDFVWFGLVWLELMIFALNKAIHYSTINIYAHVKKTKTKTTFSNAIEIPSNHWTDVINNFVPNEKIVNQLWLCCCCFHEPLHILDWIHCQSKISH